MIVELATFIIKIGKEIEFENNLKIASKYLSAAHGYLGHSLRRCIEQKNKYVLTVNWNTLNDHTEGFRQSENFKEWRKLLADCFEALPVVEHFELIVEQKNNF